MSSPVLRWGAATDAGVVREANEDAYLAAPPLFVVADGMGGHQAGEVASAIAVDTMRTWFTERTITLEAMVDAVEAANRAIYATAADNSAQEGMGTTLTAVALAQGQPATDRATVDPTDADTAHPDADSYLVVVNVGDSRTYRFRDGELQRATLDHSYVQELISAGHLTDSEARLHPRRNIVTRALGIEPAVVVDAWALPLVAGDRFVLCSDGLVDEVEDDDICDLVAAEADPQVLADRLVAAAIAHGGRDNITVIVVDIDTIADTDPDGDTPGDTDAHGDTDDAPPTTDAPSVESPTVEQTAVEQAVVEQAAAEQPAVEPIPAAPLDDDTGPIPAVVPPAAADDDADVPVITPPATEPSPRWPVVAAVVGLTVLVVLGIIVLATLTGDDGAAALGIGFMGQG